MSTALTDVRVVALEQAVALPYATFLLAEMGADVIKVEPPGGDVIRGWDSAVGGLSTGFVWLSANKRDIAVDLSADAGREVVLRLAATADVFVENFAPGVMDRLGLSYQRLSASHHGLVYASLSGYGQNGPYHDVKAYDLLIQGEAGLLASTGSAESPAKIGPPVTDLIGGSAAAFAILAALHERARTGHGRYLDVSMFDASVLWLGYYPQHYWHGGGEPPRSGLRHQYLCPYGPYLASDAEYVNLVVASDNDWTRFCELVVGRPDWLHDQRFSTIAARRTHRPLVEAAIEQVIASKPSAYWLARLKAAGLPHGRLRSIGSVLRHPQLIARRLVAKADSPVGEIPLIRFPLAGDQPRHVPAYSEHRAAVLAEAGYGDDEIAELAASGVTPTAPAARRGPREHAPANRRCEGDDSRFPAQ